jgi:hypothetical protein
MNWTGRTAETGTIAYHTLTVKVGGTTPASSSNTNAATGNAQHEAGAHGERTSSAHVRRAWQRSRTCSPAVASRHPAPEMACDDAAVAVVFSPRRDAATALVTLVGRCDRGRGP